MLTVRKNIRAAWMLVERAKGGLDDSLYQLEKKRKQLKALAKRLDSLTESWMEELEDAKRIIDQSQTAIEALEHKVQVYEDMVLPLMTQEQQAYIEREKARTDLEVRRQVAYGTRGQEEG